MTQPDVIGKGNIEVTPAIEEDPEEINEDIQPPEEVNEQKHTEDSDEQVDYKSKYASSFKEAMRLTRELEKEKGEKAFQKNLIAVAKDVDKIHEIAKDDSKMADRICKEYWGKTYSEAVSPEQESGTNTSVDYESAARKVFREEKEREEKKQIEDYELQYFIDRKIDVSSDRFKKIMSTYNEYQPKTVQQAKTLLEMAHNYHFKEDEVEMPSAPASFGSRGAIQKSEFSEEDRKLMQEKGWDAEKMRAFQKTNLY